MARSDEDISIWVREFIPADHSKQRGYFSRIHDTILIASIDRFQNRMLSVISLFRLIHAFYGGDRDRDRDRRRHENNKANRP
jgi:uncharacterized protein (DUF1810 family)